MAEGNCNDELNEDIIINEQDGLPNVHPNLLSESESPEHIPEDEFEDLPMSLIVTNIHDNVFTAPGKYTFLRGLMDILWRQKTKDCKQ